MRDGKSLITESNLKVSHELFSQQQQNHNKHN